MSPATTKLGIVLVQVKRDFVGNDSMGRVSPKKHPLPEQGLLKPGIGLHLAMKSSTFQVDATGEVKRRQEGYWDRYIARRSEWIADKSRSTGP